MNKDDNVIYYRDYVKALVKHLRTLKEETNFQHLPAIDVAWLLILKDLIIELENNADKGTLELGKHFAEKMQNIELVKDEE